MPGTSRSFVQIGVWSFGICAIVALPVFATARSVVTFAVAMLSASCVAILSTLTIVCDDDGVEWYFTGRLFRKRLSYREIASYRPASFVPLSFGYRIGPGRRAWIVSGRRGITIRASASDIDYIVGCDDPAAVCAEIARRSAAASA